MDMNVNLALTVELVFWAVIFGSLLVLFVVGLVVELVKNVRDRIFRRKEQ